MIPCLIIIIFKIWKFFIHSIKKKNVINSEVTFKIIDKFFKKKNPLIDEKIEDIINTFDEIANIGFQIILNYRICL